MKFYPPVGPVVQLGEENLKKITNITGTNRAGAFPYVNFLKTSKQYFGNFINVTVKRGYSGIRGYLGTSHFFML